MSSVQLMLFLTLMHFESLILVNSRFPVENCTRGDPSASLHYLASQQPTDVRLRLSPSEMRMQSLLQGSQQLILIHCQKYLKIMALKRTPWNLAQVVVALDLEIPSPFSWVIRIVVAQLR